MMSIAQALFTFAVCFPYARAAELPSKSTTVGALLVGWGLSMLIFGILCLQTWLYFSRYVTDSPWIKVLVSLLWVLEVGHQLAIGHACWRYLVVDYGSLIAILTEKTVASLGAVVILGVIVGTMVKIFLGWRIYKVSGRYEWIVIVSLLALAQMALGIAFAVQSVTLTVDRLVILTTLPTIALSLGAATDVIIALVLSFYLHTMRTGYQRSERLIDKLIIFSVNTGALTSAFSLSVAILFRLMPDNFVFISIYFLVCKLYSNSCLATLNSRRVSGRGRDHESRSYSSSHALSFRAPHRASNVPVNVAAIKQAQSVICIGVHHETEIAQDHESIPSGRMSNQEVERPDKYDQSASW
ncbi:unnamed protein product [Peniophora sp. CBMAI 1063]|nr:unnamed protein product [Peniophora sp. CBMAI 1063]